LAKFNLFLYEEGSSDIFSKRYSFTLKKILQTLPRDPKMHSSRIRAPGRISNADRGYGRTHA
jgi:hypothetical protein